MRRCPIATARPGIHNRLLLLRRGPIDAHWDVRALGQADPPLAEHALEAETRLVEALRRLPLARVLSSDLARARATAERLAEAAGATLVVRRDLREQRLGAFQERVWADIIAEDEATAVAYFADYCRSVPPRGESLARTAERVARAIDLECRRAPRQTICYVGHAGPIRAILAHSLGLSLEQAQRFQLDPFGLSIVDRQGTTATLTRWNESLV